MKRIAFVWLLLGGALPLFAVRSPLNEAFVEWRDAGAPRDGVIPSPADMSHLAESYRLRAEAKAARQAGDRPRLAASSGEAIPSSWDSRTYGWVTPVRNQGGYGTCWAHSTMACLETAFLKGTNLAVTNDFSENHLASHNVGFEFDGFDDGGNDNEAMALLTAWRDPLFEEQDPYPNKNSTVDLPSAYHVQDVVLLPARTGAADNDALKRGVMEYGAVSVSYHHSGMYLNDTTGAHYYSGQSAANHAVTLVGWDDNYSKNNFKSTRRPPANGAFLVKNSWGTSNFTNGYTWISYYDTRFAYMASAAYPQPAETNNYGRVYGYAPCGYVESYNVLEVGDSLSDSVTNWCANVFSSVSTGVVAAVGFQALSAGTEYEIALYRHCLGSPATGTRVLTQSGVTDFAGYVTIPLATGVSVDAAERFAVALRLKCPGTDYPLPVEQTEDGYCTCTSHAGESWYSPDAVAWTDLHHFNASANFVIQAYTAYGADGSAESRLIASSAPEGESVAIGVGESSEFSVVLADGIDPSSVTCEWTYGDTRLAETGTTLVLTPTDAERGEAVITCRVSDGTGAETRSWSVSVCGDWHVSTYAALTNALMSLVPGDRVIVAPGTYEGTISAPSIQTEIIGEGGPSVTTLVSPGNRCCYYGAYAKSTLLAGFTLTGGSSDYGGGAWCGTISNCVVRDCTADIGGGIYWATVYDCVVSNCSARETGGIDSSTAVNCLIVNNTDAAGYPGAYGSYLYNCTLYSNGYWACELANTICTDSAAEFADAAGGDFRLSARSQYVDAGSDAAVRSGVDLDGHPRVYGPHVDFGCYEYDHVVEGWSEPSVPQGSTAQAEAVAVSNALVESGFPAESAGAVTTLADYNALNAWAESCGLSAAELAADSTPLLSAALDAGGLLSLVSDDIAPTEVSVATNGTFSVLVDPVAFEAAKVDSRLLAAAIGLRTATALTNEFSTAGISVRATAESAGIRLTAVPSEVATNRFFRVYAR